MRTVIEIPSSRGTSYAISDGGVRATVRTTCETVEIGGRPVTVFYDADMNVLRGPSTFMLRELGFDSENTREQATSALRLLSSYSAIIEASAVSFGKEEARGFVRFARGSMGEGIACSFRGLTRRSEATINAYLRVVRLYMRYLGVHDSPFLDRAIGRRAVEDERLTGFKGYAISARIPEDLTAPPYISRSEYAALKIAIGEDPSAVDPAMPIVRLAFEHGMRIGEILGLTLEDLQSEVTKEGDRGHFLVLRDRVSDRADQHAKSLRFKPRTREDYASEAYRTNNVGYQRVPISEDLFFAIDEYVEATRAHFTDEQLSAASADSVGGRWSAERNQYVFLNTKGGSLTADLWNKRLRGYFSEAGIHVDAGRRKTNLNHRLRHGFAMVLKRDLGVDDLTAKILMRHRSVRSIQPYLLPTDDDVHRMQAAVTADLQKLLLGE